MTALHLPPAWQLDPTRAGRLVVITNGVAHIFKNGDPRAGEALSLGSTLAAPELHRVIAWALHIGVENVWLLDGELQPAADVQAILPEYRIHELTGRGLMSSQLAGLVCQFANGGNLCTVWGRAALDVWAIADHMALLPEWVDDSQRATILAHAWMLASTMLCARFRFSPSYTGLQLMRDSLRRSVKDFAKPSDRFAELIAHAQAHPLAWIAPPLKGRGPARVWSYDRNWSYVTSARSVPLGDPVATPVYVPSRPGFYRISAAAPRDWHYRIPGPFRGQAGQYGEHVENAWAWEPEMRAASRVGWHVEIHEGYYWPRGHTADLRDWQENLWRARRVLSQLQSATWAHSGPMARAIVKQVGLASIGRLKPASGHRITSAAAAGEEVTSMHLTPSGELSGLVEVKTAAGRDDLVRPEWWSTIIANAGERVMAGLWQHAEGVALAAYVDAVYTSRPRPFPVGDPEKAGGWHLEADGVSIPGTVAYGGDLVKLTRAVRLVLRG